MTSEHIAHSLFVRQSARDTSCNRSMLKQSIAANLYLDEISCTQARPPIAV
jgi:hypothetical protein